MKKVVLAISGLMLLASCEQAKFGYVDNVKLMDDYQEKVDLDASFKMKTDALEKKRDSISNAFQIEAQAFQLKAQSMTPEAAQQEYGVIQQKGQIMGQQLQQEEQTIRVAVQTEMDSLVNRVKDEVKAYGKSNGYNYILTGGNGGSVLYGKESEDLTEEIVKILNDKYKK